LTEERLPLGRTKRLCRGCHRRLHRRFWLVLGLLVLGIGLWGAVGGAHRDQRLLDVPLVWLALFLVFQWTMIVPHELGHALAARCLGFSNVRIVIGSGRPLCYLRCLGFACLVNRIPFGGFALADPPAAVGLRTRLLLFVAAGPAVNLVALVAAWVLAEGGALWGGPVSLAKIFMWANGWVLVENLIPQNARTGYGPAQSDGMLLWKLLFRWGKPWETKPASDSRRATISQIGLKWLVVSFLSAVTAVLVLLAVTLWLVREGLSPGARISLICFFAFLALVNGSITVRHALRPAGAGRNEPSRNWAVRAVEGLRARSRWANDLRAQYSVAESMRKRKFDEGIRAITSAMERYPNDTWLLTTLGDLYLQQRRFVEAEHRFDEAAASVPDVEPPVRAYLLAKKLWSILARGDVRRAMCQCDDFLAGTAALAEKWGVLDALASASIYEDPPRFLAEAEGWARKALELAPDTPTLMGTLGGVLAEQGRYDEAEPLLRACCDRSRSFQDQGISQHYLGWIAAGRGEVKRARRLLRSANLLHGELNLAQKARRRLEELDRAIAGK
jgi:tetratricopeptide (TPR) repeat protein